MKIKVYKDNSTQKYGKAGNDFFNTSKSLKSSIFHLELLQKMIQGDMFSCEMEHFNQLSTKLFKLYTQEH